MKRTLCAILTAVFLSALCIPCGAADTGRTYPGFSDVAEGGASYSAIKYCYERGLMNGTSETAFHPQEKLNVAQLVVLAARLYDIQNGGDGSVPKLPDLSQPYLRFYDREGNLIASYATLQELPSWSSGGESFYFALSDTTDDLELPESCILEVGYEGYGHIRRYEDGVKETPHPYPGAMNHGLTGTGYRFSMPDPDSLFTLPDAETVEQLKDAWWFPAAFYLGSEGVMGFDGELVFRASGGNQDGSYDPLTRFSSDNASRSLFAWLVDLTAGELPVLNENAQLPADVNPELTIENAESVLRLYQAGILTGVDQEGNFGGDRELTRAQAAIMLNRVLDPEARVKQP